MTTASQAFEVVRTRLATQLPLVTFRTQGLDYELPDTPAPFVFLYFEAERGFLSEFGDGRGANRYRNPAVTNAYAMVPRGWGLIPATDLAEQVAAVMRSYRDADVSVFEATVYPGGDGSQLRPPGMESEVGNYYWAGAEILFHYDLIG